MANAADRNANGFMYNVALPTAPQAATARWDALHRDRATATDRRGDVRRSAMTDRAHRTTTDREATVRVRKAATTAHNMAAAPRTAATDRVLAVTDRRETDRHSEATDARKAATTDRVRVATDLMRRAARWGRAGEAATAPVSVEETAHNTVDARRKAGGIALVLATTDRARKETATDRSTADDRKATDHHLAGIARVRRGATARASVATDRVGDARRRVTADTGAGTVVEVRRADRSIAGTGRGAVARRTDRHKNRGTKNKQP